MDVYLTFISLAFFEDTGLFISDYDRADYNFYGWQAGCNFINKPCIVNDLPQSEEFCHFLKGGLLELISKLLENFLEKKYPEILKFQEWIEKHLGIKSDVLPVMYSKLGHGVGICSQMFE